MNAAEYLIGFFESGRADSAAKAGYHFPDVVRALAEVESAIESWETAGMDVHLMRGCLERWKQSALNVFSKGVSISWNVSFGSTDPQHLLSDGDLMGLQTVAEKMSLSTISYSDDARERMREMIDEAIRCISEDNTLPTELVVYLSRLIREAREALDEYDVTGDFKLSMAFDRLCNAIRVAEAKTKKHPVWEKFNEQFMIPLIAQVGVNAVVWGLSAAQVLPQIGS